MDVSIRPTRRPFDAFALAEASIYSDDFIGGFSVVGGRSFRLRGTTPDPLDAGARPGRDSDILFEGRVFPVVSSLSLEESQAATSAMLARHMANAGRTIWNDDRGHLTLYGPVKVMIRCCRQCGAEFRQWRFVTQRRRYSWFCTADHRAAYKRVADRQRQRERRSAG
jgi:hypothetical protein